jgi:hypothetical protein
MEQELFSSLENNPNLTNDQQQKIVEKMNQLSNMRINLYQTLSGVNNYYQNALNSSQGTLKEQTTAIYIVESELNQSKRRLDLLNQEKNNKIRLVEINNYYGDKYAEHTTLMKIVIFTLVPIIILTIIYNKGFLPSRVYYLLFIIVGIVGAVYFWKTYASIITRDNMNYNEYNWAFNANSAPKGTGSDEDPWAGLGTLGTCIGEACCQPDQTYDTTLNQCVTGGKEGLQMLQGASIDDDTLYTALTKTSPNKYKADVNLTESYNAYNV